MANEFIIRKGFISNASSEILVSSNNTPALSLKFPAGAAENYTSINFQGNDGTYNIIYSQIKGGVEAWSPDDGMLVFRTSDGGTLKEQMRLKAQGVLNLDAYGVNANTGTATYGAAWDVNGNFVEVPLSGGGTVTLVSGTGTQNGLTLTGAVSGSGNLTLGGTLAINNADWSGTVLSAANGGTGLTSISTLLNSNNVNYIKDNPNYSASGIITFTNATASPTNTTGAVIITGGLGVSGAINAGGDITAFATSDRRLKKNITPITNPIEKVKKLSGNTFDWNEELQDLHKGSDVGIVAQELNEVLPDLVTTRDNGYMAVKYDKIVALLIETTKAQQTIIEKLEKRVNDLESKL
jgi:hypothetical protein